MATDKQLTKEQLEDILDDALNLFQDQMDALIRRRPVLLENTAFMRGFQWSLPADGMASDSWDDGADIDEREEIETINIVRPAVNVAAAQKIRSSPNPQVVPAGSSIKQRAQAKLTQKLLHSFFRNGVIPYEELYRAALDSEVKGMAFLKVYWNPWAGKYEDVPMYAEPEEEDGEESPVMDQFGDQAHQRQFEGDVRVEFKNCLDILVDRHAKTWAEHRFVFERCTIPRRTLTAMFPEDFFGEPTEDRWEIWSADSSAWHTDNLEADGASQGGVDGGDGTQSRDEVGELVRMWWKPGPEFPRGLLLVFSGKMLVHAGSLNDEYPWVPVFGRNVVPNGLVPDGTVTDLKAPQRNLNLAVSKKKEFIKQTQMSWLLNPIRTGVAEEEYSDLNGNIIPYEPANGLPRWTDMPPVPPAFSEFAQENQQYADLTSNMSETARGMNTPEVKSGKHALFLYEFQQGASGPDLVLWEETIRQVCEKALRIAGKRYEPGRAVRIMGENKAYLVTSWDPENFDPTLDVVVDPYSQRPRSRATRFSEAADIMQMGGFGDTPDAERFRKAVEYDSDDVDPLEDVYTDRALQKILMMAEGRFDLVRVYPFEPHDVILEAIDEFRNSPEYDALPNQHKQMIDSVHAQHEQFRNEQFAAQQQQEAMAQGKPQGQPSAPAPAGQGSEGRPAGESLPEGPAKEQVQEMANAVGGGGPALH